MDRAGIGLILLCFCVGVPRALGQNYVNVATQKTYSQVSKYWNQGPSSNAANGDTGGTYGDSNCIHTQVYGTYPNQYYDTNPWWEVDLGRSYPVYSIKVWARSGFRNRLYPFTITVDGQQCAKVTSRYSRSVSVTCSSGVMYGQVVRLTRTGSDRPLNLCEFQIFVPSGVSQCYAGYYGAQCTLLCSSNCGGGSGSNFCYKNSGSCYDGCQAGWYGDTCNAACPSNCLNNQCNQQTGVCTACAGNFAGDYCTDCQDGYYKQGAQCVQCSSNCAPNTSCNKLTGKCDGCKDGFHGDKCSETCSPSGRCQRCDQNSGLCSACYSNSNLTPPSCTGCIDGFHGDKCSETCSPSGRCQRCDQDSGLCSACYYNSNLTPPSCTECLDGFYKRYSSSTSCTRCTWQCYNDTACDKSTGNCDRCPPGKKGNRCGQSCERGKYGQDCSESCGHCRYNYACDVVSGACNSCVAGFQPPLCKTGCENGTYGVDCGQTCGHCKDGTACDKVNGQCALCDTGWYQSRCKTPCPDGYYGVNCTQLCGMCLNGAVCNKTDGHCGSCPTGKQPPLCDKVCTEGFYGQNCSRKCGRCSSGLPCVHDNGVCLYGCETGYEGALCQTAKSEESDGGLQSLVGPVVGSIFGVGLLLTVSITAAICWRRRSQENLVRTNNPPIALSDKKICTPDPPTNASTAPVPANSANESVYVEVGDTENTYDKLHPYSNEDAERQQYSQFAPSGRDVDTRTADSAYIDTSLPMGKEDGKI